MQLDSSAWQNECYYDINSGHSRLATITVQNEVYLVIFLFYILIFFFVLCVVTLTRSCLFSLGYFVTMCHSFRSFRWVKNTQSVYIRVFSVGFDYYNIYHAHLWRQAWIKFFLGGKQKYEITKWETKWNRGHILLIYLDNGHQLSLFFCFSLV